MRQPDGLLRVGHCRPRTSAIRSLKLGVSFPAARSLTLLSLTDPKRPVVLVQSRRVGVAVRGNANEERRLCIPRARLNRT
jgi:hypothetical protein